MTIETDSKWIVQPGPYWTRLRFNQLTVQCAFAPPAAEHGSERTSPANCEPAGNNGWRVRPGDKQQSWVNRPDVQQEGRRVMSDAGEGPSQAGFARALGRMAAASGGPPSWTADSLKTALKKLKQHDGAFSPWSETSSPLPPA